MGHLHLIELHREEKGSCPQLHTLVGDVHQSLCRAQQQGPDLLLQQGAPSSLQHFSQSHKCAAHPALIPSMHLGDEKRRQHRHTPDSRICAHEDTREDAQRSKRRRENNLCVHAQVDQRDSFLLASAVITGLGSDLMAALGSPKNPCRGSALFIGWR